MVLYHKNFTKYIYFWVSPYGWPGIVVRELPNYQQVCHKHFDKISNISQW